MKEVGFIGVGNAGRPVARRLLDQGYDVFVYDQSPSAVRVLEEAGAHPCATAAEAARDWTITLLPGPKEVAAAVLGTHGVLEGMRPGATLLDFSGSDTLVTTQIGTALKEKGCTLVSCTVHAAGAPANTIPTGQFAIAAGSADRDVLERALPLLQDAARTVVCMPDPNMPKVIKVGVIMLSVMQSLAATEVALWLTRQGVDPLVLYDLLCTTGSTASASNLGRVLRGGLKAGGNVRNTHKDLEIALRLAGENTLPLPFTAQAEGLLQTARAAGNEGRDLPEALAELYAMLSGGIRSPVHADIPPETRPETGESRVVWLGW